MVDDMMERRLLDLLDTKSGSTPPTTNKKYYKNGRIPWLTSSEVSQGIICNNKYFITETALESTSLQIIPKESTLIAMYGATVGQVGFLTFDTTINQAICAIIPDKDIADPHYIYYYFVCNSQSLKGLATGSARTNISQATIRNFPLVLPGIEYQHRIAGLLSTMDKSLAILNDIKLRLTNILDFVYDYWFVQFDFPNENGRPYKSSGGKMVYSEQLGQEIPEGWHVSDLLSTSLATLIKPGINKFTGTKSYLATGDVISDEIKDNPSTVTYDKRETRANMQPKPNSIWFAKMKDSIKHIAVTDKSDDLLNDHIFSTGFCGFQVHDNCLGYLFAFIRQPQFEDIKNSLAHGATQKAIGNKDLASIAIIEPTNDVLSKFESVARPILYLMNHCRQESKQLASLRNWLLPMLINGQVEIKNGQ